MDEARSLADRLLAGAPLAARAIKEMAVRSRSMPSLEAIRFGETMRKVAAATEDAAEGVRAAAERRPPVWKGRADRASPQTASPRNPRLTRTNRSLWSRSAIRSQSRSRQIAHRGPERGDGGGCPVNDGLTPGTRVQVRNRFDGGWSSSPFEVAEAIEPTPTEVLRYRVRRLSDGVVLPADFVGDEVRSGQRLARPSVRQAVPAGPAVTSRTQQALSNFSASGAMLPSWPENDCCSSTTRRTCARCSRRPCATSASRCRARRPAVRRSPPRSPTSRR